MNSRGEFQEQARSTLSMLCPCCGGKILRGASECTCGGRFVGEPLDETPIKVQRFGPVITSVTLFVLVVSASLIVTKWLAFAGVMVIWSAWRAVRLAKRDPGWYGGYKTAAATLAVSIIGTVALSAYGIAHIPQALNNYKVRQIAATQAAMYHYRSLLEEYRRISGSYPRSAQQFKEATGESVPNDYWDRSIKYQTAPDAIADRGIGDNPLLIIPFSSFELRSAGPDGIIGTDDDIVMRDGIFFTNSEVKRQQVAQQPR